MLRGAWGVGQRSDRGSSTLGLVRKHETSKEEAAEEEIDAQYVEESALYLAIGLAELSRVGNFEHYKAEDSHQ